jgi:hypothetical protein
MRAVSVIVPIVVFTVAASGCSARPDPSPSTLIGTSVTTAAELVPPGRSYAWYDLSRDILHKQGELVGGDRPDGEGGVIVAVCADSDTIRTSSMISAGAIPRSDYHGAIKRNAAAGEYRALLPECQ